jgi:hypothetical protein
LVRTSPGIGLAALLVTIPLMLAVPGNRAWVVAFAVLCVYPVVDAARNAVRWSWLVGALVSTMVWVVVLGVLVGVADQRMPAGLAWLTPGQKVKIDYVYRDRVPYATYVAIFLERKGCKGDERWNALAPPAPDAGLTGSTWEGRRIDGDKITGEFSNELGWHQPWTAHRIAAGGDAGIAR